MNDMEVKKFWPHFYRKHEIVQLSGKVLTCTQEVPAAQSH